MKSIILSIRPQWVEKILNGEKTIEIRKTMPKCELPCKVYIYCTKTRKKKQGKDCVPFDYLTKTPNCMGYMINKYILGANYTEICLNGKVVAEFTLNKVECFTTDYRKDKKQLDRIIKDSCVDFVTLKEYEYNSHCLYALHIDELKICDKPKDLKEFERPEIDLSKEYGGSAVCPAYGRKKITRAPQNWCYCEMQE